MEALILLPSTLLLAIPLSHYSSEINPKKLIYRGCLVRLGLELSVPCVVNMWQNRFPQEALLPESTKSLLLGEHAGAICLNPFGLTNVKRAEEERSEE